MEWFHRYTRKTPRSLTRLFSMIRSGIGANCTPSAQLRGSMIVLVTGLSDLIPLPPAKNPKFVWECRFQSGHTVSRPEARHAVMFAALGPLARHGPSGQRSDERGRPERSEDFATGVVPLAHSDLRPSSGIAAGPPIRRGSRGLLKPHKHAMHARTRHDKVGRESHLCAIARAGIRLYACYHHAGDPNEIHQKQNILHSGSARTFRLSFHLVHSPCQRSESAED